MKKLLLAAVFLVSFAAVATGQETKSAEKTVVPELNGPLPEKGLEDCAAPSQNAGEASLEHCKDANDEELMRKLREQILPQVPTPKPQ